MIFLSIHFKLYKFWPVILAPRLAYTKCCARGAVSVSARGGGLKVVESGMVKAGTGVDARLDLQDDGGENLY